MSAPLYPPTAALEADRLPTRFGLRFWDMTDDEPVEGGLRVTATIPNQTWPMTEASVTRQGLYAFLGLPGLLAQDPLPVRASPPAASTLFIEIVDTEARFLPAGFHLDPSRGLPGFLRFPTSPATGIGAVQSPPTSPPRARQDVFFLFSAPQRRRRSPWVRVHGELVTEAGAPCPHAIVRVWVAGFGRYYGMSDEGGRFCVLMPYPPFRPGVVGSPPFSARTPPEQQTWEVRIAVRYQPGAVFVSRNRVPDVADAWAQGDAFIIEDLVSPAGPAVSELRTTLESGRDLAVTTQSIPTLVIRPGSPP
ncbi:MAG: hypothetical protein KC933_16000 [Myxococcales bacterium]|nr:hypothetical protein [Myxococcales bacterium]MCB9648403.1 hypothetical protein [Deltaproteobacteria bacterium]